MFIKTTKTKGLEYIKLVESYRDENNVTRHNVSDALTLLKRKFPFNLSTCQY